MFLLNLVLPHRLTEITTTEKFHDNQQMLTLNEKKIECMYNVKMVKSCEADHLKEYRSYTAVVDFDLGGSKGVTIGHTTGSHPLPS